MTTQQNTPPLDVRVFEITLVVAIADYYGDGQDMDVSCYYNLVGDVVQLAYRERELTVIYKEQGEQA